MNDEQWERLASDLREPAAIEEIRVREITPWASLASALTGLVNTINGLALAFGVVTLIALIGWEIKMLAGWLG